MTAAKKLFSNIFVVAVNFYLLTFFAGLFFMFCTVFTGGLNAWLVFTTVLVTLLICIIYQVARHKWDFTTIGEIIIGSISKQSIIAQSTPFTLTRVPIFLLILLTLALNSNIQDGLSEGQTYSVGVIILLGLFFSCIYYGLKNFFIKPEILPIILVAGGLFLVGVGFKYSPKARQTGDIMFNLETGLALAWIAAGLIYKSKTKPERQTKNDIA